MSRDLPLNCANFCIAFSLQRLKLGTSNSVLLLYAMSRGRNLSHVALVQISGWRLWRLWPTESFRRLATCDDLVT